MFRRTLFEDDLYILSVGILGGIRIQFKEYNSVMRVPGVCAKFLHLVVREYEKLGGRVAPGEKVLNYIFTRFIDATFPDVNRISSRVYYGKSPETIAREAIDMFDN